MLEWDEIIVVSHSNQWSTLTLETFHEKCTTALPLITGIMFFQFLVLINKIIAYVHYLLTLFLSSLGQIQSITFASWIFGVAVDLAGWPGFRYDFLRLGLS